MKNARSVPTVRVILGNILTFLLLFAVLLPAGAAVSFFSSDAGSILKPVTLAVLCIVGLVGGLLRGKKGAGASRGWFILSALMFVLIGTGIAMILGKGKLPTAGLLNFLCFFGCAVLGSLLFSGSKKRKRRR